MIFYQQMYLNRLVVFGSYELLLRLTVLFVSLIVCNIISKKLIYLTILNYEYESSYLVVIILLKRKKVHDILPLENFISLLYCTWFAIIVFFHDAGRKQRSKNITSSV